MTCYRCGGPCVLRHDVDTKWRVTYAACLNCGRDQTKLPRPPTSKERREVGRGGNLMEEIDATLAVRNQDIVAAYLDGRHPADIAGDYGLTKNRIQQIIRARI